MSAGPRPRIFTVGHSSLSLGAFLGVLSAAGVERVADVRRYPGSRRHPRFSREALAGALAGEGLGYLHLPELGGYRTPEPASRNTAFEEEALNAYADHAAGASFHRELARLEHAACERRTAILCAEADPLRCHRRILADVLQARGWSVLHLSAAAAPREHVRTPFARVEGDRVTYPGGRLF